MVLLFHIAGSYELYGEDATLASELLGLALWPDSEPTVSFTAQYLEAYLCKFLHAGHRVAICESVEETP
jgi:DNA mismatch repair ATPase MutS